MAVPNKYPSGSKTESGGIATLLPADLTVSDARQYIWTFQFASLAGGKVSIEAKGPSGAFVAYSSGHMEGSAQVVDDGGMWTEFRLTFLDTGAAGIVNFSGRMRGD